MCIAGSTFNAFIFFLRQKRELLRFFQVQAAVKKEQQLSHIFNAQSDAVLVIESPDDQISITNCNELPKPIKKDNKPELKVLFCNNKSVEMFGFNLTEETPGMDGFSWPG